MTVGCWLIAYVADVMVSVSAGMAAGFVGGGHLGAGRQALRHVSPLGSHGRLDLDGMMVLPGVWCRTGVREVLAVLGWASCLV